MRVLMGTQNILDESDERWGTPARMSAGSAIPSAPSSRLAEVAIH
jgi:hypothetical protein